jgi:uncharacterized protein involved in exopolysaccharide biosynthesis/Mrp family chromosome partitioning ATPase
MMSRDLDVTTHRGDFLNAFSSEHVPPMQAFRIIWRNKFFALVTFIGISVAATTVISIIPLYYDATALLMVDTRQSSFRDLQATVAPPDADLVAIATQVGIMKSATLAESVVDRLNLTQVPEFAQQLEPPPGLLQGMLGAIGRVAGRVPPPTPGLSEAERRQLTAGLLEKLVAVVNDGKSYIISVRARTSDPQLSANIANTFVAAFLDIKQAQKVASIHSANEMLEQQLPPLEERVRTAEQAVETYRGQHGLILNSNGQDGALGATLADQQLARVNAEMLAAKLDLSQRQASLHQIREAQRTGHLEAAAEVIGSPVIAGFRAQQAQLATRTASLAQVDSEANPSLRSAVAAQGEVQRRIAAEVDRIANNAQNQVAVAQSQVDQLTAELARLQSVVEQQSQSTVTLRQLESKARAERAIYQDYLGRFEGSLNQINLQVADAAQVSVAKPPIGKSGPPRGLYLAVAVAVSAAIAACLALLMERLITGVRTKYELETQTGLYGLGFVPIAPRNLKQAIKKRRSQSYFESVNMVSDLLRFGGDRHRAKVVLVTSAAPAEGKTIFATSLAASVGATGGTALLIDCDLRRPSIARVLRLSSGNESEGEATVVRRGEVPGVDIVTFRFCSDSNQTEFLRSVRDFVDNARDRYDLIVLDAPPVLPFPDASKLARVADGTIIVVRWRHTAPALVVSAMRALSAYGGNIIGGVVTQVDENHLEPGDGANGRFYRHYTPYVH